MCVCSHGTFIWEEIYVFFLCSSITQDLENCLLYTHCSKLSVDFISEHYLQHVNEHKLSSKADFYVSWCEGHKECNGLETTVGSGMALVF